MDSKNDATPVPAPIIKRDRRGITPPASGGTVSDEVRKGLAIEDNEGLTIQDAAARIDLGSSTYLLARTIVLLADNPDLRGDDAALAKEALRILDGERLVSKAHKLIEPLAIKVWGTSKVRRNAKTAKRNTEAFERTVRVICEACNQADTVTIPQLSVPKVKELVADLKNARVAMTSLLLRLRKETP